MKNNEMPLRGTPLRGTPLRGTPPCGTPLLDGGKPSNVTIDSTSGTSTAGTSATGVNPTGYQGVGALVGGAPVGGAPVGGAPVGGAPVGGSRLGGTLSGVAPLGKARVGKTLLVIGLIGIMLAGCNDSSSGSGGSGSGNGSGNGNGGGGNGNGSGDTTGVYTCENGNPENGNPDGTADVEDCKSCLTNYVLVDNTRCVQKGTFTCTNGTAATGSPDGTADAELCILCQSNYVRDASGRCIDKGIYTCANGTPATGSPNGTANVERCAFCQANYVRDAAGRCVSCAATLAGPSDATHDMAFLCGSYTQVKVPLSNQKNYIIYTDLSANNYTAALSNTSGQTELMETCPHSHGDSRIDLSSTACESPSNGGQRWFIMPLQSGTYTLNLFNISNSNGGSYKLLVQEHQDYVAESLPRLLPNQTVTINGTEHLGFWVHFVPNTRVYVRPIHIDAGYVCTASNRGSARVFWNSDNGGSWVTLGGTYSKPTFLFIAAEIVSGIAGVNCQLQFRF